MVKMKRKIDKKKYITVLSFTTVIFLLGIMLGQVVAEARMSEITKFQEDLSQEVLSLELKKELLAEDICAIDPMESFKEKIELGNRLHSLEERKGTADEEVKRLKNKYSLLSIQHYTLMKEYKEACREDMNIILFFYSNTENEDECGKQGHILDYAYDKDSENIVTYAFDMDIHNPAVNTLTERYEISVPPTIVVNNNKYEGLQTLEDIEGMFVKKEE